MFRTGKIEGFILSFSNTMAIKGKGRICDCYNDELSYFKDTFLKVIFEDSITSIGKQCFMNFERLSSITFGNGVTEIEKYAFYNTSITSIIIPKNIRKIKSKAFANNNKLKMIEFEEGENEIIINKYSKEIETI